MRTEPRVLRLFIPAIVVAAIVVFAPFVGAQEAASAKPDSPNVQAYVDTARLVAGPDPNLQGTLSVCLNPQTYRTFLANMPAANQVTTIKAFDQLYYLGMRSVGSWVLVTNAGIIQFDALDNTEEAQRIIVGGYKKLGLDPTQMKYLIITHYHADHSGGAKYLQDTYHPHVLMGSADWDMLAKQPTQKADGSPAIPPPSRDMSVTDGQKLTLGDTTVTLYLTPGHTPASVSSIIPVTDHGQPHLISFLGGTAFPQNIDSLMQSKNSLEKFTRIGEAANVDVVISNHSWFDNTFTDGETDKGAKILTRKPGDPNPFVVGQSGFVRYMTIMMECADAARARLDEKGRQ